MNSDRLHLARHGDRDALAALLTDHGDALRRIVDRQLSRNDPADLSAEDVLQVTFTEAFLKIQQCTAADDQAFAAWLERMAINNLRDAIRRLQSDKRGGGRRVHPPADATRTFLDELLGSTSRTPSRAMMQTERDDALRRALDSLPADDRLAIQLYDLEGLTIDDVAARLQRRRGAIHMLRKRAHERLRAILSEQTAIF